MLLKIVELHANVEGKKVLNGVNLSVGRGELVALMGPNGSGKTSLSLVVAGHPKYIVESGDIIFDNTSIKNLKAHERSLMGIFLAFQNPPEVGGARLVNVLLASYNKRLGFSTNLLHMYDSSFLVKLREAAKLVGLDPSLVYREMNVGFSGGEKKRSELVQALILRPRLLILDEPDSGLDADGLESLGRVIGRLTEEGAGVLLITHYARVYKYVNPSRIYVMYGGKIIAEGGMEIARKIEEEGYKPFIKDGGNS